MTKSLVSVASICVAIGAIMLPLRVTAGPIFPDKVLESAVRKYVFEKRDNNEPLTEEDVENISTIEFKGHTYTLDGEKVQRAKKVRDLTGLEKCRSLALLDLEDHEVMDLTPIEDLKNLQSLNLAKNQIKDIQPIEGLIKLQYLQLEDNQIDNITPLAKLENMRSLYLTNNRIKNIETVARLTKVWSLYLGGNQISDITPIANLKNLDTIDLRSNGISDISALADLTPSRFLFLQDNKITDLSVLATMAKKDREGSQDFAPFWNVYLSGNPLSEEAKSKQLPDLRKYSLASRIYFE